MSSTTISESEIGVLDGVTAGTATASKAVVLDANKDIATIRNLTSTNLTGTLQTSAQGNITSVGTLTSLTLSGAISGATTIGASGMVTLTNNTSSSSTSTGALVVTGGVGVGGTVTATNLAGTLTTAAQGNITSVGTLTSLTLSGGISGATSIGASGLVTFTNTTLSTSASTGGLVLSGGMGIAKNITVGGTAISSASWLVSGIQYRSLATTYTNNSTSSSGTAVSAVINSFAQATIAASNTSVTTSRAATVYIDNAPVAGTNMTLTNTHALWVENGSVYIDSAISSTSISTGSLIVNGGVGIGGDAFISLIHSVSGTLTNTATNSQSAWNTMTADGTNWLDGSFTIMEDFYGSNATPVRGAIQIHNGSLSTSTNSMFIGTMTNNDLRFGCNDSTKLTIQQTGRVGIGTSSPGAFLEVSGSVSSTIDVGGSGVAYFLKTGGLVSTTGPLSSINVSIKSSNAVLAGAGFYTTSDARLKKDFTELDDSIADAMLRVKPLLFRYKNG
ncbi:hypothetical protein PF006_g25483 [Phytophthora fragariae]|uniref:Peptidase S74 domain-containing protein n=1 Tax=Phytophthora fragariae TaxID=53985 RepID=A0A6A3R856_9STRA|nr:hypothetical protein PF006_g25483 [Phytophthora fragariae]